MEYIQMTLNEWVEMKQRLRKELLGVRQSFVRIGFMLRRIEEQKGYEQDGYKSIAEFAQKELGLHPSTTTRFMEINREYSVDGYSERLREEYLDLSRSQLEEMLKLPEEDRQMIQTETPRENIRELKRFNAAGAQEGADDFVQLVVKFYEENPDTLNGIFSIDGELSEQSYINQMKELVNPSGNRSYKRGLYFLMMYENKISVKKFGQNPENMTWEEFARKTWEIFGESAAGNRTWESYFGKERNEVEKEEEQTLHRVEEGKKEIAPAQKSTEILERNGKGESDNEEEYREKESGFAESSDEPSEQEEEKKEGIETRAEIVNPAEVLEKPFGSRKDYMDNLTAHEMAIYIADEYRNYRLKVSSLAFSSKIEKWLEEKVDSYGMSMPEKE